MKLPPGLIYMSTVCPLVALLLQMFYKMGLKKGMEISVGFKAFGH